MYHATTNGIRVTVMPVYIDERSSPQEGKHFWAYRVVVANEGNATVQLVSRYWHITDAKGHVEEVRGKGVVGEQPILRPGDTFEYTSGCPLNATSGFMRGHYSMVGEYGDKFDIAIPAFPLDLPDSKPVMN